MSKQNKRTPDTRSIRYVRIRDNRLLKVNLGELIRRGYLFGEHGTGRVLGKHGTSKVVSSKLFEGRADSRS